MECRFFALALAAMGVVLSPFVFPSTSLAGTCTKAYKVVRGATLRRRVSAKKIARKKVYKWAKRRCRGRRVVFMARWQYKCRKKGRFIHCKARNKIRCCGAKRKRSRRNSDFQRTRQEDKPTVMVRRKKRRVRRVKNRRYRIAVAKARRNKKYKIRRKKRRRSRRRKKFRRRVASRKRRRSRRKRRKRRLSCRKARLEVKGLSRGRNQKEARIEARGHARIRANERCGNRRPIFLKGWSYKCARSGKRYICRAWSFVKCCK